MKIKNKKLTWATEKRKISELKPYEKNPRRMTDRQNANLARSLYKYGLVEIPAINRDGTIIAGHQRLRIFAEQKGEDYEIDVRVPDRKLTEKEVEEYCIRSNKNTGEWDFSLLTDNFEIGELKNWGFEDIDLREFNVNIEEDISEPKSGIEKNECPKCGYKW